MPLPGYLARNQYIRLTRFPYFSTSPQPLVYSENLVHFWNMGANPNAQAQAQAQAGGFTTSALQMAFRAGNEDIAAMLLEYGADPNIKCYVYDGSAVQAAAYGGDENIVKLLLEKGVDIIGGPAHDGYSGGAALQVACYRGHVSMVKLLLERRADPY